MMTLTGLPEDITSLVLDNLHVVVLLNVLLTCKQLYAMRHLAFKRNATICAFDKCNPDVPYMRAFCNSDVEYDEHMHPVIKGIVSTSRTYMYNTYKLFVFDNIYNDCDTKLVNCNRFSLSCYYARQIAKMYPVHYRRETIVYRSKLQFNNFMETYNWNYTNIDIFDIYDIIFCVRAKNNRRVAEILETMQITEPIEYNAFGVISKSLLNVVSDIGTSDTTICGKILKASMISMLFKFLLYVPLDFITGQLYNTLIVQADDIGEQIERMQNTPKYLKKTFRKPLNELKTRLLSKL